MKVTHMLHHLQAQAFTWDTSHTGRAVQHLALLEQLHKATSSVLNSFGEPNAS